MPTIDFNDAIRRIVEQQVEAALAPHQAALTRLHSFLGARPGPGRPPRASASAAAAPSGNGRRRGRRPNGARANDRGDASKFKEGQHVRIRVGRGSDTGTITKIDLASGSVWVKRDNGKGAAVKRPARGVQAA